MLTAFPVLTYFLLIVTSGDLDGPLNLFSVPAGAWVFSTISVLVLAAPLSAIMEHLFITKLHLSPLRTWLAGGLIFVLVTTALLVLLFTRQMPFSDSTLGAVAYFFSGVLGGALAGPLYWSLLRLLARARAFQQE